MAHFAEVDANKIVLRVVVINNSDILDNGVESEAVGAAYCAQLFGGEWLQTSYHGNIRGTYAAIGYKYDAGLDEFLLPTDDGFETYAQQRARVAERWAAFAAANPELAAGLGL